MTLTLHYSGIPFFKISVRFVKIIVDSRLAFVYITKCRRAAAAKRPEFAAGCGADGSARALGAWGRRFKSCHPDHTSFLWPLGQAVKTPPFHGGNRSSSLLGVTILLKVSFLIRAFSSVGQSSRLITDRSGVRVPEGPPFIYGPVAQLVRALACHARGRGFEPHPGRHFLLLGCFGIFAWLGGLPR